VNATLQRPVRVLLADNSERVRTDLRALLQPEPVNIVAEAADGRDAVGLAIAQDVDVAVLDLAMPALTGIEATREIRQQSSRTRVLMLSSHKEEYQILGALDAGAQGYVSKTDAGEELAHAIREVSLGHRYMSSSIRRVIAGRSR
jgi:DNA-binding NarL/FixJ family response regulator